MNLTNAKLINIVKSLGETRTLELLEQKLQNDAYRKNYNKAKNAALSALKQTPEYKAIMAKVKTAK